VAANITYRDVLGLEQSIPGELVRETVRQPAQMLAQEIAQRVTALNGGAPSALFLAGGGSKLEGLRDLVAEALEMEDYPFCLAVQWNPEFMTRKTPVQRKLFQGFVDACRK